ncbi:ABC transporter ATP-binding protein [Cereibacter azotoformans]|uniref:Amino acid/amide ABC transporter ATP-binding protein 2 (HAAT family) n=1 Tax=Cereibacter azotoformans TaxID=43057 RepID=A0A2T5KA56_9RHOB|nr:ABC transporter ATP-binding protein [Cereibacter azotoformans]AXQ95299.1 ABC transporter ATP-binding protein [Cereibacter sphaeroides]PTR19269.1 amino acid/amide ABC transporter ATP-binding protein 2 (HAAT family) [Cereibacter azotoformans]UIJ32476.1 ABC transporter ATP-binding protein [Cereibacter azotoformans]
MFLRLQGIIAGYGGSQVLAGIDLGLGAGEAVALLGRNGMGKTTTVRTIFGLLRPTSGRIEVAGRDLTGAPPFVIARAGLGLVPEGRQIFPTLSVEENLVATARGPGPWDLAKVYALFPRLAERKRHGGSQLSGGEQQMLAIGRALMTNPRLLVLDEATEGLAPLIRSEIWDCLGRLRAEGLAILVIDKNIGALSRLVDRHVVIERGRLVWQGSSADLAAEPRVRERFLHV